MTTLLEAAKAVIARWDTPACDGVPATAAYINALREAVAGVEAQTVELVVPQEVTNDALRSELNLVANEMRAVDRHGWANVCMNAALALSPITEPKAPAGEREALIVYLRAFGPSCNISAQAKEAADMLAADAQEIARLREERDSLARTKLSDKDAYEALRAELDWLKQQEPIAHFDIAISENMGAIAHKCAKYRLASGTPLYLAAGAQQVAATCTWTQDDDTGAYDTQCGGCWHLNEGTPEDHGAKFCPYCGGGIVVKEES